MRFFVLAVCMCTTAFWLSCGGNDDVGPKTTSEDSVIVAYLDTMGITDYQVDDQGIYYYPITLNATGKTQADGSILSIYYELSVLNGNVLINYDSTDGDPLKMKQGAGAIYPVGIDQSLQYMKEGEEWVFIIPSELAYVDYESTLIPENAKLVFRASLEQIQNDSDIIFDDNQTILNYSDSVMLADTVNNPLNQPRYLSNGMIFKRLAKDTINQKPAAGNELTITYTAYLPYQRDTPADQKYAGAANPFVYSHKDDVVISGLDAGVAEMNKGERALFVIPSLLAYRESAAVLPNYLAQEMADRGVIPSYAAKVGPYEVLIFEVKLLDIKQ